jgi:4-amino-4-deoxy-L-arabinose transferase-like glycosyltransferase
MALFQSPGCSARRWPLRCEAQTPAAVSLRSVALLIAATLACLLPFVDKAYHIDDPLFVWVARQVAAHPLDFYGFTVNWYGYVQPFSEVTKNPPLFCYWLALAGVVGGWREEALHIGSLFFSLGAVLGAYQLGRLLTGRPTLAALLSLLTPVFLISATQVMCDVPMLCLWVWCVCFWIEGERRGDTRRLWLAALLAGLCGLTKYFGAALIPLLAVYSLARNGRPTRRLGPLLLPVLMLAGYQLLTWKLYGRGLFSDAGSYAVNVRPAAALPTACVAGVVFIGGCFVSVFAVALGVCRRRTLHAWSAAPPITFFALLVLRGIGSGVWLDRAGVRWAMLLTATLFLVAGAVILALLVAELRQGLTAERALLALWVAGTLVFALFVNWSLNGRSVLPLAPVLGVLAARRIDDVSRAGGVLLVGLPVAAALALFPAWADYAHANAERAAAAVILAGREARGGSLWFVGHWGFQYYMEAGGARPVDFKNIDMRPGDEVAVAYNNSNIYPLPREYFGPAEAVQIRKSRWIRCMDSGMGAGFYADIWGPLPFAVGAATPDHYVVMPVKERLAVRAGGAE